jgi:outer membrane lipoprotein-sorting protein
MWSLVVLIVVGLIASAPAKVQAQDQVGEIVKKMKEVFEPVRPSTRKVTITATSGGETVQWVARSARKQLPNGKWVLMVLLEPAEVKGNAYMIWEPEDKPSSVWSYLPLLRRVRQLVGVDAYDHFLGTDFTYADLGFVRLQSQYKLLGEEDHAGKKTYKIEETVPQERAYYSRIVTWVDKASSLPLRREYYDVAGTLWKTETFDITTIDGVPTPTRILMQDLQGKTSTEMRVSEIRYDVDIPDSLFNPAGLPAVANSPVWQSSTAQAASGK